MSKILCKAVTLGTFGLFLSGAAVFAQSPTDTSQQPSTQSAPMSQANPTDASQQPTTQSAPMSQSNPTDTTMPTQDTPPSGWHGPDVNDPALNLTQDQKDKISRIQDDMHSQAKSAKSDTTLTDDQRKAKMKDLHHASEQQIMQVLTPDQQKTWKSMKSDAKRDKNAPAAH